MGLFGQKPILNIDSYIAVDGFVTVAGWVVSMKTPDVKLSVRDQKNRTLPVTIDHPNRPGISELFFGDHSRPDAAFKITFKGDPDALYTVVADDGSSVAKNTFLPTGYSAQWKHSPKSFVKTYVAHLKDLSEALKTEGFSQFVKQAIGDYRKEGYRYDRWLKAHTPSEEALLAQRKTVFEYMPKLSLVVPAYRTPEKFLREMIGSVLDSTYANFELVVADGSYPDESVVNVLAEVSKNDPRVRYKVLTENKGISGNTNEALTLATGDWVVLMDHDDLITPDALFELVKAMNVHPEAGAVYTDEDKISMDLSRCFEPQFKPDFDPVFMTANNYICHLFAAKRELFEKIGGFVPELTGAQDQDVILKITELTKTVHVPKILYHWRMHPNSTAEDSRNKMYCYEAGMKSVNAQYKRLGIKAKAYISDFLGHYETFFDAPETETKISVILTGDGDAEATKRSVLDASPYQNYEWLDGTEKVNEATGEYLFFIQKGAKLITLSHVLGETKPLYAFPYNFLGRLADKDTATVGGKVYDAAERLVYGGSVRSASRGVDPVLFGEGAHSTAMNGRLLDTRRVAAVSIDCCMMKKSVYFEAGGFDETLDSFGMTDLSLTLSEAGFSHVYDPTVAVQLPFAVLDRRLSPSGKEACRRLIAKHETLLNGRDPAGNENMTVHLDRYVLKE